jgi:hypothetical protein
MNELKNVCTFELGVRFQKVEQELSRVERERDKTIKRVERLDYQRYELSEALNAIQAERNLRRTVKDTTRQA